jgi:multidrug efflux system membrane fusion protein
MLAAAAWLGFAPPAAAQAATPVTVVHAIRTDVPEYASGIGTVQAYRSVLVRARVDGNLDSINFAEGQTVHPGDLLATIDPRPYAATLAQARAKRGADQALLENARLDLARYDNLVRTNVASRQQADTQAALVNQYLANIQGDDAAIDSAALNLSFCRITAPIEGVAGLRLIDIGNLIHATDATGIVSIMQVHPISLVFTLPQEELPAVRAAIAAEPPSSGGLPVAATGGDGVTPISQGHLVTINNTIDTATGTITLKAEFANTDNKLWPGQFTNGLVRLRTAHDALTLPPAAIQHGPDGLYVYVVKPDKTVAKQAVMVGYQDERAVIVTAGLSGGETVVLSGQLRLAPGVKVDAHQGGAS